MSIASRLRDPSPALLAATFAMLVVIWSSTWLVLKIGLDYFPPFFGIAFRFSIAGPLFLGLMAILRVPFPRDPRDHLLLLTIGILSFVTSFGVVYWGTQYITSGLAAVLFATLPILTGLVSIFLLKEERLTRGRVLGLVLGLAGIVVINLSDLRQFHPKAPLAALVVLIGPLATAVSSVLSKRRSHDIHPLAMAGIPITYGGLINVALWLIFERNLPLRWELPGILSLAYLTVVGSMLTFASYYWLLRHMEVGRVNLIAYFTPVLALAIGFFLGGESVNAWILIGAGLVLAGVAMAGRRRGAPAVGPDSD